MSRNRKKPAMPSQSALSMSDAGNWLRSAKENFDRIRRTHAKKDPCVVIEHYTDVIAEATAAEAFAANTDADVPGIERVREAADALRSTATKAQRGAVKACSLGIRRRG